MPWRGLRPKSAGHRRHSSVLEGSIHIQEEESDFGIAARVGPLERLSLGLSNEDDRPFFSEEPHELDMEPVEPPAAQRAQEVTTPEPAPSATAMATAMATATAAAAADRPEPERATTVPIKPHRFSLLKFRHASDSQLSSSYKVANRPPLPDMPTPTIITTSPTTQTLDEPIKKRTRDKIFKRNPSPLRGVRSRPPAARPQSSAAHSTRSLNIRAATPFASTPPQHISFDEPHRHSVFRGLAAPPAYGDLSNSSLALPVSRLSESSRSEASLADQGLYAQTTTTHTISTTTTFFRLPRRKKDKGPLFPLPVKIPPPTSGSSANAAATNTNSRPYHRANTSQPYLPATPAELIAEEDEHPSPLESPSQSRLALTNAPVGSPGPAIARKQSNMSQRSGASTPSVSLAPPFLGARGRSSTMGSLRRSGEHVNESPPMLTQSGRNSTSTSGRKSFGDLFSLHHRLRQNSEPPARHGSGTSPGTPASKTNSFQIPREPDPELIYPQRLESDTPASYLEKLEAAIPRGAMATILCKSADEFSKTCLRKYMRGFSYFGDSIDMAVRKMLMEVELPKETQQIDRLLAGFADRYHECNPGIFCSADEASIVAFSILLLHSDTHNKSNKKKMQKHDYVKNTQGGVPISHDVLECLFDNVCYTPFIHFEDEVAITTHRLSAPKAKKSLIRSRSSENIRGPVDPYNLILDHKLDLLRPSLKDVMDTEDTYTATGTAAAFDAHDLQNAFHRSGVLQVVSARSRPDAFLTQATITNPAEAQMGLVSIKVAKVGLLWRKDPKKKKTKSPWREWGAILTDSKLYFFKDIPWTRRLISQYDGYDKSSIKRGTLVYKPPMTSFEPDAFMSMDDAVALMDSSYKKHKNAFVFIKHGGFEEIFLANSESDMNDWMGKLNYAATFRTANVLMRGMVSVTSDGERHPLLRKNSEISTSSDGQAVDASMQPMRRLDPQAAWEIMFYRRQIISEKISDADEKLAAIQKELDHLLRDARHLQVLLPIQAKTREAIVLAAGRMSAKLKWTRVELWRTKCHRDILKMDLAHEGAPAFPVPGVRTQSVVSTPPKSTPVKIGPPALDRRDTEPHRVSRQPGSPVLAQKPHSPNQTMVDKLSGHDHAPTPARETPSTTDRRRSDGNLEHLPALDGTALLVDETLATKDDRDRDRDRAPHTLLHDTSLVSSHHHKLSAEHYLTPTTAAEALEERRLREAGLVELDGAATDVKRPGTGESKEERVDHLSPAPVSRERGGSVRRSLHRTLRDSQHSHQSPHHVRGRKGRDSGSSSAHPDDDHRSMHGESDELKRGTGSFIVHGKKASVITLGSEWQAMSNEDRLKLRKKGLDESTKADGEDALEDGEVSTAVEPTALVDEHEDEEELKRVHRAAMAAVAEHEHELGRHDDHTDEFYSGTTTDSFNSALE